jgi:hypothetical protein
MNEQIGVTYFPVLGGTGYHMAVFYTNRAGETSVIEVAPAVEVLVLATPWSSRQLSISGK